MSIPTSPDMDKKNSNGADWEAWQTSFMNETFTNLRRFTSIPFLPGKIEPVRKGVTPREVVYEEDQLKVYHYIGEGEPKDLPAPGREKPGATPAFAVTV